MEKLYNNIILQDDFAAQPNDAQAVPYLQNPPKVIDVTVGRQLFVDDFLIESTDLAPVYHKAKKYEGNPVLKAETPWRLHSLRLPVRRAAVSFTMKKSIFSKCGMRQAGCIRWHNVI